MGLLLKEGHRILQFSFEPTSKVSLFVNEGKKGTFFLCVRYMYASKLALPSNNYTDSLCCVPRIRTPK